MLDTCVTRPTSEHSERLDVHKYTSDKKFREGSIPERRARRTERVLRGGAANFCTGITFSIALGVLNTSFSRVEVGTLTTGLTLSRKINYEPIPDDEVGYTYHYAVRRHYH